MLATKQYIYQFSNHTYLPNLGVCPLPGLHYGE
jgi:hypothetical protein